MIEPEYPVCVKTVFLGLGVWVKEQWERHLLAENRRFACQQGGRWAQRSVLGSGHQSEVVLWKGNLPIPKKHSCYSTHVKCLSIHLAWASSGGGESVSSETDRRLESVMTAHSLLSILLLLASPNKKKNDCDMDNELWAPRLCSLPSLYFSGNKIITLLDNQSFLWEGPGAGEQEWGQRSDPLGRNPALPLTSSVTQSSP